MAALLAHHLCFQASGAKPCWSASLDSLVSDSRRVRRAERAAAEEANALSKAWEEGVMITAVSRQGCGGLGRGGRAVCLSSRAAEDPIQLAWPQLRLLCHQPPRLSSRQCLSGQVDGSQQTAGPHACRRGRGSVSRAQLRRDGQPGR